MRYLLECRIEQAKELISYSDYALKEIAERVGFKNIHHFTRVFSEITGVSPGLWRQQTVRAFAKTFISTRIFPTRFGLSPTPPEPCCGPRTHFRFRQNSFHSG
jgi:AraC-like DNA-binding protein